LLLQASMTEQVSYDRINPYPLRDPVAPHIAAGRQSLRLSVQRLAGFCRGLMMHPADLMLIEGAGGWRVPLNEREFLSDLARELDLPIILVVDMRLGCVNHAVLTAEAICRDGLKLAGWVANQVRSDPMAALEENLQTLLQRLPAPCLGVVPFSPDGV